MMASIAQDLRFAVRSIRKSPGFAVVATVTLALAIGVNTSIFSLVSAIVFLELPMQDTETVAVVRGVNPELEVDQGSVSAADFLDLRERSRSFESLSALTSEQFVMTGLDRPERVTGIRMTAETFDTWRLPPVLGRAFTAAEGVEGAANVVMLTHGFWQDRFGARRDVLSRTVELDGVEHTIIGVAHPDLEFASFAEAQVLTPLRIDRTDADRSNRVLFVTGRLAPGVTQEMAEEEVASIGEELEREYPEVNAGWALWSAPPMESLMDDSGRTILVLLQLTVAMVILIACANVANMLLARATTRAREMAVRTALGAGRGRLIRQLLTESLLISLAAAGLGIGVAYGLNEALVWISAGTSPEFLMAELDGRVLLFTLLVSLVAPLIFGLFPAVRASAAGPAATLRDGRSADAGRGGRKARSALVTAQVALALTLMIVAGLLTRSMINLQTRPLGYEADDVVTVRIDLPERGDEGSDATLLFFREAREAVAALPAFDDAELASTVPGIGFAGRRSIQIEGTRLPEGRAAPTVSFVAVSTGLLPSLGLSVQEGRGLQETDDAESFPVMVVSREVAERFFPGGDPIGARVRVPGAEQWIQVVGVVDDVRTTGDGDRPATNVYVPFGQDVRRGMYVIGHTRRETASVAEAIRQALWTIDADLPVGPIRTVERLDYERSAGSYALITIFLVFAVFALVMAAVGIYGVMAYAVSRRGNEIGVRLALGAEVSTVRSMVLVQGAKLMVVGLVLGLLVSVALSRMLSSVVFGISATDPLTFVVVPVILAGVAFVANLVPAIRATRTDPAATLRAE